MDIKTFLDNIHEHVCCPVCMTRFTKPKQLPCLHSFCLNCLQSIQQTCGIRGTVSCPECRRNFRIPGNGDLNAFPTDFRVNSLLDAFPVTECNTSGIKCGNCGKTSGESAYCFTCCSFWCDDCLPLHNRIKAFKDHHALALKDFRDEDFENILKQPTLCGKKGHEKKALEFFCQDCKITICNACALLDHEGHVKILLEEAAEERKSRIKAAIESKKRRALKEITKIAEIDEKCILIQEEAEREKKEAQQSANIHIAAIEARKNQIFDEVENKVRESLQRLGEQRHEIQEDVKMQETEIEKTEMILKRSTNAQIMQPHEFLDKIIQGKAEGRDSGGHGGGRYGGSGGYQQHQSSHHQHQSPQQQRPRFQQNYGQQHYSPQQTSSQSYNQPQQQQHQPQQQQQHRSGSSYDQYYVYNQGYQARTGYQQTGYAQQQPLFQQPGTYQNYRNYHLGYQ